MTDINTVVAKFVELRDRKKAMEKELEEKLAPIGEAMEKLKAYLLAQMQASNVDSFKSAAGTAYKRKVVSATMADAEVFRGFVMRPAAEAIVQYLKSSGYDAIGDTDQDMIEKIMVLAAHWGLTDLRVGKKGVEEFMETSTVPVPGINLNQSIDIGIRRS